MLLGIWNLACCADVIRTCLRDVYAACWLFISGVWQVGMRFDWPAQLLRCGTLRSFMLNNSFGRF